VTPVWGVKKVVDFVCFVWYDGLAADKGDHHEGSFEGDTEGVAYSSSVGEADSVGASAFE
jgi:hypothetical protein